MAFPNEPLAKFQDMVWNIYGLADDRLYSNWDLISNMERFTMWGLKGIRKGKIGDLIIPSQLERTPNPAESFSNVYSTIGLKFNLLLGAAWLFALTSRLHIDLEEQVWQRYPYYCPYCGQLPCNCKDWKGPRATPTPPNKAKPATLSDLQKMLEEIYPAKNRTLEHAGVHWAEELGELSEAWHLFEGTHKQKHFQQLELEAADYFTHFLTVANSAGFNFAEDFYKLIPEKCHVCGKKQCVCNFF
jgi:NTP pyrophosphatase (non-canonical NTP hydrolase)